MATSCLLPMLESSNVASLDTLSAFPPLPSQISGQESHYSHLPADSSTQFIPLHNPPQCDSPDDSTIDLPSQDPPIGSLDQQIVRLDAPLVDERSDASCSSEISNQSSSDSVESMLGKAASVPAIPDEILANCDGPESANGDDRANEENGSGPASGIENSDAGLAACASGLIVPEKEKAVAASRKLVQISKRRTFFLVKMTRSVDLELRSQIKLAELQLEEACKNKDFIFVASQLKKASKVELLDKLKIVRDEERACKQAFQKKRMEIDRLQILSSEEELNDRIAYMHHRIQHESIPLKEEKQLIKEIKQLESARSRISKSVAAHTGFIEIPATRKDVEENCRILYDELEVLKKEQLRARAKCEAVERDLDVLNEIRKELVEQLENARLTQQNAYIACKNLKKLQFDQNARFYNNKDDIRKAKELALNKGLEDLEALCHEQVEGLLTLWNNDASFRKKYIKNNEQSTVRRLETLDGRSLGPDEEPILLMSDVDIMTGPVKVKGMIPEVGTQVKVATDVGDTKVSKAPTDAAKVGTQSKTATGVGHMTVSGEPSDVAQQQAKADKAAPVESLSVQANDLLVSKEAESKITKNSMLGEHSTSSVLTVKQDSAALENAEIREAQGAELKDKCRQQEMERAREAAERKKRQAEKLQAKALLRAQRETERRDKEREKKARKKSTNNSLDSKSSEVACQSEAREVAVTTEELPQSPSEAVNESSSLKRKLPGRKSKVPRHPVVTPYPKRATWALPTWVWVTVAVMLLSIFVALLKF